MPLIIVEFYPEPYSRCYRAHCLSLLPSIITILILIFVTVVITLTNRDYSPFSVLSLLPVISNPSLRFSLLLIL